MSALLALLTSKMPLPVPPDAAQAIDREALTYEARAIAASLNDVRFSDIAPPDLEAEQHAREHLEAADDDNDDGVDMGEEVGEQRKIESLEDAMARMGAGTISAEEKKGRPTMQDVVHLTSRLRALADALGVPLPLGGVGVGFSRVTRDDEDTHEG